MANKKIKVVQMGISKSGNLYLVDNKGRAWYHNFNHSKFEYEWLQIDLPDEPKEK